jgi:putative lipoic acid-binding regulatory protein
MTSEPELIFPVSISLRIIGRSQEDFPALVVELVTPLVPDLDSAALLVRPSRDGNYISVVLPVRLESRAQFDAVYRVLNEHEAVIMVL